MRTDEAIILSDKRWVYATGQTQWDARQVNDAPCRIVITTQSRLSRDCRFQLDIAQELAPSTIKPVCFPGHYTSVFGLQTEVDLQGLVLNSAVFHEVRGERTVLTLICSPDSLGKIAAVWEKAVKTEVVCGQTFTLGTNQNQTQPRSNRGGVATRRHSNEVSLTSFYSSDRSETSDARIKMQ